MILILAVLDNRIHRAVRVHVAAPAARRLHILPGRIPCRGGDRIPQDFL